MALHGKSGEYFFAERNIIVMIKNLLKTCGNHRCVSWDLRLRKKMFIMTIATVMIEYHDKNVFDSNANHNSYEVAGEEEENRCRKK